MAGSNMQKAEFCISPRTVKCYFGRLPAMCQATHVSNKGIVLLFNRSFGKEFLNQRTKK